MKRSKTVELFLTLGLAITVGACGNSAVNPGGEAANETAPSPTVAASPAEGHSMSAGGEGGEGGEGGSVSTGNANADYMATLGLMKGHLIVAQELMDQGNYEQAEPHIDHPVDELYGSVEGQLSERNVPDFKATLTQLQDAVKSTPESAQTKEAYTAAMQSIDSAIAAIPEAERQSPEFVLSVMSQILKTAADEYEASIADGKFVELVEYQDSRGFVLYAEDLYETIASQMSQERPDDHKAITDSLTELKTAWTSVTPPATPVKTASEVRSLISEIELRR